MHVTSAIVEHVENMHVFVDAISQQQPILLTEEKTHLRQTNLQDCMLHSWGCIEMLLVHVIL
jgi:hypothetical protein